MSEIAGSTGVPWLPLTAWGRPARCGSNPRSDGQLPEVGERGVERSTGFAAATLSDGHTLSAE